MGPDLSETQFGFTAGRSTIDALGALRDLTQEAVRGLDVVLSVSLDVANAFNSLPFETLVEALRFHGVPPYLRTLLGAYLQDREVLWEGGDQRVYRHSVCRGVPQESVLGPVLWNLGYDWLLRCSVLPRMRVLCYANDTLVTCRGTNFAEAARLATIGATFEAID